MMDSTIQEKEGHFVALRESDGRTREHGRGNKRPQDESPPTQLQDQKGTAHVVAGHDRHMFARHLPPAWIPLPLSEFQAAREE